MKTITLYHATNTPVEEIGIEKKTMFFTSNQDAAIEWGDEHYEDGYEILEIEMPLEDISEYIIERPQFAVIDFELLEVKPEKIMGKCVHYEDCCNGYIVKDINEYELR